MRFDAAAINAQHAIRCNTVKRLRAAFTELNNGGYGGNGLFIVLKVLDPVGYTDRNIPTDELIDRLQTILESRSRGAG